MTGISSGRRVVESEVVVVGAGLVGAFTALRLAQKGKTVCLVEKGLMGREASGRAGGGVRQQFRDPNETPLAMEAIKIWSGMADELGRDVEYRRHGSLRLIQSEKDEESARIRLVRERKAGLEVIWLSPQEIRERLPNLAPDLELVGGTLCPTDGTANPLLLVRSVFRAVVRAGVAVCLNEPVNRFVASGGRVTAALTDRTEYRGSVIVNTAGAWARDLCRTVGLDFPVVFRKSQIVLTEVLPPMITGFVSFENGYVRQALAGNLHLGVRGQPTERLENTSTYQALMDAGRTFPVVFPFMRRVNLIRGFAGITTWPPDQIPIIDRAPGLDGLYLAAGFSGHGFCLAPLVGRLLAEWIADDRPLLDLSAFAWARFDQREIETTTTEGAAA